MSSTRSGWLALAAALMLGIAAPTPAPALAAPLRVAQASADFREGRQALDRGQWNQARGTFAGIVERDDAEAPAALYWKAYAEIKGGRVTDARSTLNALFRRFEDSRWADDGRALELELSGGAESVNPADVNDELKLYALEGLMNSSPERALPYLVEFLQSDRDLALRRRALFILGHSEDPAAGDILINLARSASEPEMQAEAVRMLSFVMEPDSASAAFKEIYRSTDDPQVRHRILEGLMVAEDAQTLLEIGLSEPSPELRASVGRQLGGLEAIEELKTLYRKEAVVEVKMQMLDGFAIAEDLDMLLEIASAEPPPLGLRALRALAVMDEEESGPVLERLYAERKDPASRRIIVESLAVQENAEALTRLFRQAGSAEEQRDIVQAMRILGVEDAEDLYIEILEGAP